MKRVCAALTAVAVCASPAAAQAVTVPQVHSYITGSSTGQPIVQHPGAPVPQPFSPD